MQSRLAKRPEMPKMESTMATDHETAKLCMHICVPLLTFLLSSTDKFYNLEDVQLLVSNRFCAVFPQSFEQGHKNDSN